MEVSLMEPQEAIEEAMKLIDPESAEWRILASAR
jgi:hypothetical protein